MDFNFDLNLVQSQKLILTPQLKQALEILKMTSQELFEYVEEEFEENPVLETIDNENDEELTEFSAENVAADWEYTSMGEHSRKVHDESDYYDINDFTADKSTVNITLKEHLLFQLHTSELNESQMRIGEYLIDNTDENGYITVELSEVAAYFNVLLGKVRKVLLYMQTFDPPGICSRSLKECLLIQLKQMNNTDQNIVDIINKHLDDLGSNKIAAVAKSMGLPLQKVVDIFDFIKTLEPKPGRAFYNNDEIKYIIPDVVVKEIRGKYEVIINEDSIPLLGISDYYKKMVATELNPDTKKFVQSKLDSAAWLIKCIEQRKNTLRKVAESIVSKQTEFFEKGKNLNPLTMKIVANEVEMHESTVSRTVNGKYLQCSWGVYEMRYFFSGKLSSSSGEEISTENIKNMLRELIKSEDKRNPLSDNSIAELFKQKKIDISRRTVAKYRSELDIPAVSKRKKF